MRKSAGTAVLAIAPLAAVSSAPEAQAQTLFGTPGLNVYNASGGIGVSDLFPEPNRFFFPGSVTNDMTTTRLGVDGFLTTLSDGNALVVLTTFSTISGLDIPAETIIPVAYSFTLSKQEGFIGNVSWNLATHIQGDSYTNIANGTLTTGTATFTGSGNHATVNNVVADFSAGMEFILTLSYSTLAGDILAVQMNSASQGFVINGAVIPEPSAYAAILGLGALGFMMLRRSRRTGVAA